MLKFTDLLAFIAIEDAIEERDDSNSGDSSRKRRKSWAEQYEEAKKVNGWKAYTGCLLALILALLFVLDCSGVI